MASTNKEPWQTFPEYKISNCAPVPREGEFPQANESRLPCRLSTVPIFPALTKQSAGLCNKFNNPNSSIAIILLYKMKENSSPLKKRKTKISRISWNELTEKHACVNGEETKVCFLCRASPFALRATNSPVMKDNQQQDINVQEVQPFQYQILQMPISANKLHTNLTSYILPS